MKCLALSLSLLLAATASQAATVVTLSGTVGASQSEHYTTGQEMTIRFVLADYTVTGDPVDGRDEPLEHDWWQDEEGDSPLFSDVSLSGADGSFQMPSGGGAEMYLYLYGYETPAKTYFLFTAGADGPGQDVGLSVQGDAVRYIFLGITSGTLLPGLGQAGMNPESYLSTVYGTYSVADQDGSYIELASGDKVDFLASSMTIAAIPEPSALALLALPSLFLLRRRRD